MIRVIDPPSALAPWPAWLLSRLPAPTLFVLGFTSQSGQLIWTTHAGQPSQVFGRAMCPGHVPRFSGTELDWLVEATELDRAWAPHMAQWAAHKLAAPRWRLDRESALGKVYGLLPGTFGRAHWALARVLARLGLRLEHVAVRAEA